MGIFFLLIGQSSLLKLKVWDLVFYVLLRGYSQYLQVGQLFFNVIRETGNGKLMDWYNLCLFLEKNLKVSYMDDGLIGFL